MDRAIVTRAKPRALVVFAVALTVLVGCDETLSSDEASSDADSSPRGSDSVELFPDATGNTREDVEAPEVFNVTEAGLWDGRPSLGGIWVAHPDVTQPERVRITNTANNKSTTGALFRRERNLPGPALQLSSAAAEKLGILAGAPTRVDVVALRRKPVEPVAAEPEPEAAEEPAAEPEQEVVESAAVDVEADGEAAVEDKPKRKWWQKKETAAVAGAAAAAGAATADAADTAVDTATETAADTAEVAAAAAAAPSLTDPEVTPPADAAPKRKWWQKKEVDEITETPLDPIEGAAAAIEASDPTPVAAEAPASGPLSKPYVQVGTFGVEANAKSAADKIRRNGLSAEVRELKTDDKIVWRVVVGPASTRAERNAIHRDVKDLGFSDAFTVKN